MLGYLHILDFPVLFRKRQQCSAAAIIILLSLIDKVWRLAFACSIASEHCTNIALRKFTGSCVYIPEGTRYPYI